MLPIVKFIFKAFGRIPLVFSLESKVTHLFLKTGQPNTKMANEEYYSAKWLFNKGTLNYGTAEIVHSPSWQSWSYLSGKDTAS